MKNEFSPKKKLILFFCLIVAAVLLVTNIVLAIYTSQVYQRSVVRNRDNDVIRFSSDKLYRVTAGTDAQKYYYPMGKGQRVMSFMVCNYDQSKNTLFSEKNIGYTITLEVADGTAGFDYTVSDGKTTKTVTTGNSVTFTNSLRGGARSADSYTFTFSEEDYGKVNLLVTVTPDDTTLTQGRILNGILIPIEYAATQGVTVKGEFTDSTRGFPDEFDAYNLSVSVSGGAGNVLITWDHTMLDIDPFFKAGKAVSQNGNESTITVPMNSDDNTGAYLIQFYSHNSTKPNWKAWSELPISVALENTP